MNSTPTTDTGEPIAVIGMSGRFPGAPTIDAFWHNLCHGVESISFFSDAELARAGIDVAKLGPDYVRAGAILQDPDWFDAAFFGYGPREAELMDPQQRIFLEIAWEALENAGYDAARYPGAIGVYAGTGSNSYFLSNLTGHRDLLTTAGDYTVMLARDNDFLATRVAYKMNLRGPAMTVQTACSTSLVAVCQACQSLLAYQCDLALAGGVSIDFPQTKGHLHVEKGILSPDGHCRPFDATASGTVRGNGAGVVILKRLADARRDGDHILAVIKGTAVNNDGAEKVGYTAPSVDGQAEVIALAQAVAGVLPETISYHEAHGTATPLGDPIEIAGLTKAFRASTAATGFCAIGSVKGNIGHLNTAAGIAGFIKTVLALQHRQLPPSLHFETPNPKIPFADSPFFVNAKLTDWKSGPTPRRASVSSFGLGGTNAHVVVEEAPPAETPAPSRDWQLLLLSAKTGPALDAATTNLATHFQNTPDLNLADAAFVLQTGRQTFAHRRVLVAHDVADATKLLTAPDPKRVFTETTTRQEAPVACLFPGQGAQQAGMGRELYDREPVFRATVDRCAAILQPILNVDLRTVMFSGTQAQLNQTQFTQPTIFVIEYALAQLWIAWGVQPEAMVGHSIGEYVAACCAGVFTLEDALRLVATRARLMQELPGGSMLAVRLPEAELRPLVGDQLSLAAVNAPGLCVASGPTAAVQALQRRLQERGVTAKVLATSHAFHSAMMEPLAAPFTELVGTIQRAAPQIPYLSNLTGTLITAAEVADPAYWFNHLRQTVRFADNVAELAKDPTRILLEVGPGQTLAGLARQHPARTKDQAVIASLSLPSESESVLTALGRLWLAGATVNWTGFYATEKRRRIPLPSYPFERKRYWIEPVQTQAPVAAGADKPEPQPPVAVSEPALPAAPPTQPARTERILASLKTVLHDLSGLSIADIDPAATFTEMGFDSLFLTQASVAFQNKCGVKVRFRQLLEDLSTLRDLANYIDQQLPPDAPVAATTTVAAPAAGAPTLTTIAQQLHAMQQQLDMLRQAPSSPPPVAPPAAEPKAVGPFKPVRHDEHMELTASQKNFLAEFMPRYNQRTAESKRLTQAHRAALADPRSVAGFRDAWKEIVYPLVSARSAGAKLWDVDGNEYVDLTMGFGVNLFGHSPAFVTAAIEEQLKLGIAIGPQSPLAGEVARMLCEMTGHERVTFCNTGSEAVMVALRLARTVTGRDPIVYFTGDYHGVFDEVLGRAGPDGALPVAPGIPRGSLGNVVILDYGTPESLEYIRAHGRELAAVLVEPVQSRRPEFQPKEFLLELRRVTQATGMALILDEMITGFRVHPAGIQGLFGIQADLATYGKIIGGGMPIGVLAGTRQFMDALDGGAWQYGDVSAPEVGMTFFAGTFVRHPLALAAARAVLQQLKARGPALQEQLTAKTSRLVAELRAQLAGTPVELVHFGSWFIIRLPDGNANAGLLLHLLRYWGIHVLENRPCYVTMAHTDEDLAKIVVAFKESVIDMRAAGFFPAAAAGAGSNGNGTQALRVPITPAQEGIWLTTQMGEAASCAYNLSYCLRLRGALDLNALGRAVQRMVERHDALRATFTADGTEQIIRPALTIDVPLVDLSALPAAAREQQMTELVEREARVPFDLVHGPLLRAQVIRLEAQWHLLLLTVHHLVSDGQSMQTVLRELGALYAAHARGAEPELSSPMQYSAYARWQAEQQQTPAMAEAEAFWLRQFATPIHALELPADRPRLLVRTFNGAEERTVFGAMLAESLKQLCAKHNCTLFATLLAGFNILLHRLTGAEDLAIGVPTAGQLLVNSNDLVGHCMNLLPIRLGVSGDHVISEHLAAAKTTVLDAFDHQNYTFGTLVKKLHVARDASRTPLVSVLFNVDRADSALEYDGLSVECVSHATRFAEFDLFVNILQTDTELVVECNYSSDLFDHGTIQRWLGYYRTILEGIAANPSQRVGELPLLSAAERQQLLVEWNATALEYPQDVCLHQLVEQQVAKTPGAVAVVFGNQSLTYWELDSRADRLARHLRHLGVAPGTLVAIYVERSLDMVVGLLGILKAGGAYLPLAPSFPVERLAFMLDDARPAALVTQQKLLGVLPPHETAVICLDALPADPASPATIQRPQATDLAYVLYTSGSTGKPKGVQILHRAVVNCLTSMRREPGLTADDVVVAETTLSFDIAGLELWLPLTTGARVVIASRDVATDGGRLAELVTACGATLLQATPATWRMLLAIGWQGSPRLKILCGGEALPADLAEELLRRCGALWNMYGPTETTIWSAMQRVRAGQPVRIGRPIANTTCYVVDRQGQPVPVGVPGELWIGGDGVARGYLNRPELTAEKFLADPFRPGTGQRVYRTGDLVRYGPDGMLEFLGRLDYQVKIRGFRIELGEIEAQLVTHTTVGQAVVVAREDPVPATLREWLRAKLPEYMVPVVVVVLPRLPLTPNGKVDRRALPVPERPLRGPDGKFVAPRDPLELQLAKMWEKLFNRRPIGVHDNFFDLGGHSLLAVQFFANVEKRTGKRLALATLFQAPTIEQLAGLLRQQGWESPWSCLVPIKAGGSRPPFYCVHGIGGNILEYLDLAKYMEADQPFYGIQAMGLDGKRPRQNLTVEEMAAQYLKEIRALQPQGPYYFGGSSFGGTVAYEMAQQLRAAGEAVGLLAFFDTNGPGYPQYLPGTTASQRKLLALHNRVTLHWDNLRATEGRQRLEYVRAKARKWGRGLSWLAWRAVRRRWKLLRERTEQLLLPATIRQVQQADRWAALDYVPRPYAGRVTLFRATEQPRGIIADPTLGWGKLVLGGLEIYDTPGHHGAIVREPRALATAHQLLDALQKAQNKKTDPVRAQVEEMVA